METGQILLKHSCTKKAVGAEVFQHIYLPTFGLNCPQVEMLVQDHALSVGK